jgi:hypothetical protein
LTVRVYPMRTTARARGATLGNVTSTVEYTSPGQCRARADLVALIQAQVARIAALPLGADASAELAELERLQDQLYDET